MVQTNSVKPKVVVITGATGSGKSGLAIRLAVELNGEIISADSVQVYKGLNIGSGKVTAEEMQGITHYNLDILSPNESYSAGRFCADVDNYISTILAKGKLPIIVGGTTMYVKAWLEDFDFFGSVNSEQLRQKYVEQANSQGISLHELLRIKDEKLAENVHQNNTKRILRYLQIADYGEKSVANDLCTQKSSIHSKYNILALRLDVDRAVLYEKINNRVDQMVRDGLLDEVKTLWQKYGDVDSLKTIDYKEMVSYLKGEMTFDQAVDKAKQHSRNYAKRQITFMKTMPYLVGCTKENIVDKVREFIND